MTCIIQRNPSLRDEGKGDEMGKGLRRESEKSQRQMWLLLHCCFSQMCSSRGCSQRPGRVDLWFCWRPKPEPRSLPFLCLGQLLGSEVESVLSQSSSWELIAAKTGTLTLKAPHTLLNLTLLLQQEMLTPSAEILAHVPSFERIEKKRRDRY